MHQRPTANSVWHQRKVKRAISYNPNINKNITDLINFNQASVLLIKFTYTLGHAGCTSVWIWENECVLNVYIRYIPFIHIYTAHFIFFMRLCECACVHVKIAWGVWRVQVWICKFSLVGSSNSLIVLSK